MILGMPRCAHKQLVGVRVLAPALAVPLVSRPEMALAAGAGLRAVPAEAPPTPREASRTERSEAESRLHKVSRSELGELHGALIFKLPHTPLQRPVVNFFKFCPHFF